MAPDLDATGVSKRFGGKQALQDVSLRLERGSIHGLIGPNGAGKSTMIGVLAGTVVPDKGQVALGGAPLGRAGPRQRARAGLGRTFQTPHVFDSLTLRQHITLGGRDGGWGFEAASHLGLDRLLDQSVARGGLDVFPRLTAADHRTPFVRDVLTSGVQELDALLGGGVDNGSSTLIVGPAGVGKSSLSTRYVLAAAERGDLAAMFVFDESRDTLLDRAASMGMDLRPHVESGRVRIQQVDPAELSPMEFAVAVRRAVDPESGFGAKVVVIDSLNGYLNAMPEERFLTIQLHELLSYLGQLGVASFLIVAQHGLLGQLRSPVDASYLSDSVILLRYFEHNGRVLKAISVVKKRTGPHEDTIREFRLSSDGLRVGEPLENFRGVLGGNPVFRGDGPLLGSGDA